jgi:hypothetical protein
VQFYDIGWWCRREDSNLHGAINPTRSFAWHAVARSFKIGFHMFDLDCVTTQILNNHRPLNPNTSFFFGLCNGVVRVCGRSSCPLWPGEFQSWSSRRLVHRSSRCSLQRSESCVGGGW